MLLDLDLPQIDPGRGERGGGVGEVGTSLAGWGRIFTT